MNLHADKQGDALYLRLDNSLIVELEEVSLGTVFISTCES